MTTPDDPVPIVPGPSYEPQPAPPLVPPTPAPIPPPPGYYPAPPSGAVPPTPPAEWRPGRAAGNTVVVILTIVGICVGLPLVGCLFWVLFGSVLGLADPNN